MSEKIKAFCSEPRCCGLYALKQDGTLRKHELVEIVSMGSHGRGRQFSVCPGSGKPPKDGFRVGRFHTWTEGETV